MRINAEQYKQIIANLDWLYNGTQQKEHFDYISKAMDASRQELALLRQSNHALAEQVTILTNTVEGLRADLDRSHRWICKKLDALQGKALLKDFLMTQFDQADAEAILKNETAQAKARKHGKQRAK